ncbi:MAG TPA: thymidine phosphorylase, partial [Alphaproteobacteria bacterium]|nr:thymidine phosphorylase [Alphaproteobacteria bacterium]
LDTFQRAVAETGCAIIGQTADLAPADGRLYAIRDVTATVESIPLITGSILSKKLAAGLDHLVMDVKTGSGAFAAEEPMAAELAESIVAVANGAGLNCRALITDMDQVLGDTAGNALEVLEAVEFLTGARREPRLAEVTSALCAELLVMAGLAGDSGGAESQIATALDSGDAAEHFGRMVSALSGPSDFVENAAAHLPVAPVRLEVAVESQGIISAMDTRALGLAVMGLGGGRRRADDTIDYAVGLSDVCSIGDDAATTLLCTVHARTDDEAAQAAEAVRAAITVGDAPATVPTVRRHIGPGDTGTSP